MDELNDLLSQIGDEATQAWFNPEDYAVDAEVNVYPNGGEMVMQEEEEMPRYSVEELKMDIEPMLYDLEVEQLSDLVSWMIQARHQMKAGGMSQQWAMPAPSDMWMPDMWAYEYMGEGTPM